MEKRRLVILIDHMFHVAVKKTGLIGTMYTKIGDRNT